MTCRHLPVSCPAKLPPGGLRGADGFSVPGQCLMCLLQARRKGGGLALVIPPEIGPLIVLPLFDHLPPDRAGAGEQVEQCVPVA